MSRTYEYNGDSIWSISFLIDQIKQRLAMTTELLNNTETGNVTEHRKYYMQILDMQKIGVQNRSMVTPFIINLSDLSEKMKTELQLLSQQERGYVLRQAVGRLFEDVNSKLYHTSISKILKIRLER